MAAMHPMHKKHVINPLEDDPFAHEKKKNWGFFQRRRMQKARDHREKMRVEDAYEDEKLKEMELSAMETEEKLAFDAFELPVRNRLRLIAEQEAHVAEKKARALAAKKEEEKQKEEGFTCTNGFVQEFSRWRDSAALFHTFNGHTGPVLSFRLSSDYNYIVSCGADSNVKLWDLHSQKCVRTFEGHSKAVRDCDVTAAFTKVDPRAGRIVSGGADKTLRVWDCITAASRKVIRGHTDVVYACCFNPDGASCPRPPGNGGVAKHRGPISPIHCCLPPLFKYHFFPLKQGRASRRRRLIAACGYGTPRRATSCSSSPATPRPPTASPSAPRGPTSSPPPTTASAASVSG